MQLAITPSLVRRCNLTNSAMPDSDNVNMQHQHELIDMIRSIGCEIIFLAPYDPRCNPEEAGFGEVKKYCRTYGRSRRARAYREAFLHDALDTVTPQQAQGFFRAAGFTPNADEVGDDADEDLYALLVALQH